jgi:uncharacterized RDD family membrane protein YckC
MATLGRRFGAAVIDVIGLYVVHAAVIGYSLTAGKSRTGGGSLVPSLVADFVVILAYGALELTGASLGKRALKMRLRSKSGESPVWLSLAGRWLLKYLPIAGCLTASLALTLIAVQGGDQAMALMVSSTVSGMLFFVVLIDILFSLGSSRRALHDFIAGTLVVDARA